MSHPQNPHPYNIHPAWPEERLAALLRRGLGCANRAQALQVLRHLDGQLFQEYCALLAKPGAAGFRPLSGVSFEAALQIYRFDAALRVLLFDAIQTIEMSLRAQWRMPRRLRTGRISTPTPRSSGEISGGSMGRAGITARLWQNCAKATGAGRRPWVVLPRGGRPLSRPGRWRGP